MKIYPKKKEITEIYHDTELDQTEKITRKLALAIAFASVFFFFIKLLFL
jgi:hypothetical protein